MKTVVKMFKPQFAPLVRMGLKTQTVRRRPKREKDMPRVGDLFSGREWSGAPYRTKQVHLRDGEITAVKEIEIRTDGVFLDGAYLSRSRLEERQFAYDDGFQNPAEMFAFFAAEHGLPFKGILIQWKPDPAQ